MEAHEIASKIDGNKFKVKRGQSCSLYVKKQSEFEMYTLLCQRLSEAYTDKVTEFHQIASQQQQEY